MQRSSRKLHPFKLLVLLLYGRYETVVWTSPTTLELRMGPMARRMGVANSRLKDYLVELEAMGYVKDVDFTWGLARLRLVAPPSRARVAA